MLLATPLLKWYLDHGLEVTKINQVIEFKPQRCFYQFVQDVSDARHQGDSDPSKAILADTRKFRRQSFLWFNDNGSGKISVRKICSRGRGSHDGGQSPTV